jgi:DNA-directed RNA polymerase specialized sigma24 family protein
MTVKEIAEVLDITEANVKTRLKRGRDQFKNIYVREIQKNAGKTEKNENIPGYNRL